MPHKGGIYNATIYGPSKYLKQQHSHTFIFSLQQKGSSSARGIQHPRHTGLSRWAHHFPPTTPYRVGGRDKNFSQKPELRLHSLSMPIKTFNWTPHSLSVKTCMSCQLKTLMSGRVNFSQRKDGRFKRQKPKTRKEWWSQRSEKKTSWSIGGKHPPLDLFEGRRYYPTSRTPSFFFSQSFNSLKEYGKQR